MGEKNKTVVDGSVAQAMEAKIERLTKQLEIAMCALYEHALWSYSNKKYIAENDAAKALAQIDKLKE